jgi:DNA-directed RNA polymerase subunit E'/Rpb7
MAACGIKVRQHSFATRVRVIHSFSTVVFRLVVFRPFASEVILAKVKSSDEEGIRRTT